MNSIIPRAGDLAECLQQLDEADIDARGLVAGLNEKQFHWSPIASRWSIGQCLVHLIMVGRIYLPIMDEAIQLARAEHIVSRGPYRYGFVERWFVNSTEPPPSLRLRTPASARPPDNQPLDQVVADFKAMQDELRERIRASNRLDLARVRIESPFAKSLKMGLGTSHQFLAAHERRHLWQAWQVRKHAEFPAE